MQIIQLLGCEHEGAHFVEHHVALSSIPQYPGTLLRTAGIIGADCRYWSSGLAVLSLRNIHYTKYKITTRSKVDWKPEAVFDDGTKTYIRMPSRFSETPAFYILLDRKETLTNYRVKGRYYVVDHLFDRGYLKIGTKRVAIVREDKLAVSNIRESREAERLRTLKSKKQGKGRDGR